MEEKSKIKLSIIIPVYNAKRYLTLCIDSVINQSFRDFELILIDDGSTDESWSIICEYASKDSRIVALANDKNEGLAFTRVRGLKAANGEWVSFVDNDDYIMPNMYNDLFAEVNTDVDVVCCESFSFFDNDAISEEALKLMGRDDLLRNDNVTIYAGKELVRKGIEGEQIPSTWCAIWSKIIRKNIIDKIDYEIYKTKLPLTYFEDGFIIPRLYAISNQVVFLGKSKKLYAYRVRNSSFSHSIKSTLYFYNQVNSARINLEWINKEKIASKLSKYYESYLLGIMKTYYSSRLIGEIDIRDKMVELFCVEYPRYSILTNKNKITSLQTKLFHYSKSLWYFSIGKFYFDLIGRIPKLMNFFSRAR